MTHPILILFGPTASGKSALALEMAAKIDAVIINCDSKQVYKEIPIITAQPTAEEQAQTPHELYGVVSVAQDCSVGDWLTLAKTAIDKVRGLGRIPLLVGGTGMYIKMLTEGIPAMPDIDEAIRLEIRKFVQENGAEAAHKILAEQDPAMAAKLEKNDSQRITRALEVLKQTGKSLLYWQSQEAIPAYPKEDFRKFFLDIGREKNYQNCNNRFVKMIENGVLDEMKALDKMALNPQLPAMKGHGVPELLAYLHGNMTLEAAISQAQQNTRHYIKRQFTWARHQMEDVKVIEKAEEMLTF